MPARGKDKLLARNDAMLAPVILAADENTRTEEIERILSRSRPIVDSIIARYARAEASFRPEDLDDLVRVLSDLWNVVDAEPESHHEARIIDPRPDQSASYESRQFVESVWREIRLLRPMQRAALLLNLRDPGGRNAVALLVLLGIATIDEIAEAIGISAEEVAGIWNDLPIDDLRIAGMLGLTRQQVINLRKSARERLARRFSKRQ